MSGFENTRGSFLLRHLEVSNLIWPAEDVRIVLDEPPDSGETGESSGEFVSVEYSEVCHAKRQLLPRTDAMVENQAVA